MAKKEKATAKKGVQVVKKGDAAAGESSSKAKKAKERLKRGGKDPWHDGGEDLAAELASLGLRIKGITGDGNCFFRALGDQLEGDERLHAQLRQRVVSFMSHHQDDFAPFVEDDESFESYVARMRKDGVWAGYMEVVAASRCLAANLTIYQAGQPRWRVLNHPEDSSPMLHLSYHDGQHYNSVRCADDFGSGPPAPVTLRGDGTMAARPQRGPTDGTWDERDEQRVAESTACTDVGLVRKALEDARGDVDAAIERVIEALAAAEAAAEAEAPLTAGGDSTTEAGAAAVPASASLERARDPEGAAARSAAIEAGAAEAADGECDTGAARNQTPSGVSTGAGASPSAAAKGQAAVSGVDGIAATSREGAADTAEPAEPAALAAGDKSSTKAAAGTAPAPSASTASRDAKGRKAAGASSAPSNNKRCQCGSNKKYKACCGPAAAAAERRRAAAGDGGAAAVAEAGPATVVAAQVAALVI